METYIQQIELINQYLNKLLSGEAESNFLKRLKSDLEFNNLYEDHLIFVEGIHRVALKQDISKAQKSYAINKYIKLASFTIVGIGLVVLIYTMIFNITKSDRPQNDTQPNNAIMIPDKVDTIPKKQVYTTDSIAASQKKESLKNTTKQQSNIISFNDVDQKESSGNHPDEFDKTPQIIRFNSEKDTVITCIEGTVLRIKANSFINEETKRPINGSFTIAIKEYYKLSDMLLANLTTTSNTTQLETGGMLFLEAFASNEELELKKDATIEIAFPTKNKKQGMQLFSGDWENGTINWKPEKEGQIKVLTDEPEHIEVPYAVVEQVPVFPGCEEANEAERKDCFRNGMNVMIQRNFNTAIASQLGLTGKQRIVSVFKIDELGNIVAIQSDAPHPSLSEEANRVIALLPKVKPGRQRGRPVTVPYSLPILLNIDGNNATIGTDYGTPVSSRFVFDFQNNDTTYVATRGIAEFIREIMHDANFVVDSVFANEWRTYLKKDLIRPFGKLKKENVLLRKQLFEMENSRFKILEDDSITRGGHIYRRIWNESDIPTTTRIMQLVPKQLYYNGQEALSAEEFENRVSDSTANKRITTTDISNYVLKTSKLGWINCDRFINGRTKRIQYKIKIKNSDGATVNMIFKGANSVLPSWKSNGDFMFGTVADAEKVILVAIKKADGKLYFDSVETKTTVNPNIDFEFKEVSLEALKTELKKLNSLFDQ